LDNLEITSLLPDTESPEFGEPVPSILIGAKILALGAPAHWAGKDYAALAIEFQPEGSNQRKRMVLGFRDGRMWVLPSPIWAPNQGGFPEPCFVTLSPSGAGSI